MFRLISAKEQGIFGDAAMLERRDLDVGKDLVLIFFLGYRTIHKHSPADVFASTNSLMPVVIAVVSQRVLFSFLLSLNSTSSLAKFSLNFIMVDHLFRHPGMADDISHRKTLFRLKLQHVCDQIFKRIAEEPFRFARRVSLPEKISAVCCQKLVVRIASFSHGERRMTGI